MDDDDLYKIRPSDDHSVDTLISIGGRPGKDLTRRVQFDLWKNDTPLWRVAILWESACSPFNSIRFH